MNWWKWLMLALAIAILVIVIVILIKFGNCDCKISARLAKAIEAHPKQVQMVQGTTPATSFQELTWYRDQHDSVLSGRFLPRHWSFSPAGEGTVAEGWIDPGLVSVVTFPNANPSGATVTVSSWGGSLSDKFQIMRWTSASQATTYNGGSDVVTAVADAGQPPNVILLEESLGSSGCRWGRPVAFVGAAAVGEYTKVPCSATLFSSMHPAVFDAAPTAAWSYPRQVVPVGLSSDPLPMLLYVHIAVTERTASALSGIDLNGSDPLVDETATAAMAQAELDVAWANRILHANRAGITLVPTFDRVQLPGDEVGADVQAKTGADPVDCAGPRTRLQSLGFYHPSVVNVYYVDWLAGDPDDPQGPSRGLQCGAAQGEPSPVIFVSYTTHSTTTLAHELGHAFGLTHVCGLDDPRPSTDCTHGRFLLPFNVMYPQVPDGALGADARSHLTIGQSFWSNVDDKSWINAAGNVRPGGQTRKCGGGNACPPPDMDLP